MLECLQHGEFYSNNYSVYKKYIYIYIYIHTQTQIPNIHKHTYIHVILFIKATQLHVEGKQSNLCRN